MYEFRILFKHYNIHCLRFIVAQTHIKYCLKRYNIIIHNILYRYDLHIYYVLAVYSIAR